MTQPEQLAQVRAAARKALDRAVGSLSLAHGGVINVANLNVDTCAALLAWLAYIVQQEEERVQAEATKGQVTHQEFVEDILRQAEKTKREGEYE